MSAFAEKLYALLAQVHRQEDAGDLRDFLAIFGPTLDWLKSRIDALPELWDLDNVPDEFLPHLGALIGYPYNYTRDPDVQRKLIRFRIEFYRRKGTRASLERILEENGVPAVVLENTPHEGIYQVVAESPPTWLPALLEEVHPAGTKWVYAVTWAKQVEDATRPLTVTARLALRASPSCVSACGYVKTRTLSWEDFIKDICRNYGASAGDLEGLNYTALLGLWRDLTAAACG